MEGRIISELCDPNLENCRYKVTVPNYICFKLAMSAVSAVTDVALLMISGKGLHMIEGKVQNDYQIIICMGIDADSLLGFEHSYPDQYQAIGVTMSVQHIVTVDDKTSKAVQLNMTLPPTTAVSQHHRTVSITPNSSTTTSRNITVPVLETKSLTGFYFDEFSPGVTKVIMESRNLNSSFASKKKGGNKAKSQPLTMMIQSAGGCLVSENITQDKNVFGSYSEEGENIYTFKLESKVRELLANFCKLDTAGTIIILIHPEMGIRMTIHMGTLGNFTIYFSKSS